MRKILAFLLFGLPVAAHSQFLVPITPDRCLWHSGDNAAWSQPGYDDTGWEPASRWGKQSTGPRVWVRCHLDSGALKGVAHPAIRIITASAYEMFLDGALIGREGNLQSGIISENNVRQYPIPPGIPTNADALLAIRHTFREPGDLFPQLAWGDSESIAADRSHMILQQVKLSLPYVIGFSILGILGLVQLGLYFYDRTRHDLLLLSLVCIGLCMLRINELCAVALLDYSMRTSALIFFVGNFIIIPQVCFFFTLAGRRVPVYVWIVLCIALTNNAIRLAGGFVSADQSYSLLTHVLHYYSFVALPAYTLLTLAPFAALLPWSRIPRRIRLLALLCFIWGATDFVYFTIQMTGLGIPGIPELFSEWKYGLFLMRAITQGSVLIALLSLMFHDYRTVVQERAQLAGELQSAREIQRMLAPAQIPTAPGLAIEVAFRPMREVGGDFYLCRVLDDGRQRLLVGDVSGKGTAAAMTAALLLGGAEDNDCVAPGRLLSHLDRVMRESQVAGFATCLCADLAPDGTAVIANAGHLPPYCRGEEIPLPINLPLGAFRDQNPKYDETTFHVDPGDTLTFLSDGVVEARSRSGELFGFERTRRLSLEPAETIAEAAQRFGQEDDITVLRLTMQPVPAYSS
jgi:phosphoserine phosphatase RsbU/P